MGRLARIRAAPSQEMPRISQDPPELREGHGRILPLSLQKEVVMMPPSLWTSGLQSCEKQTSVVLSHPICGHFFNTPLGN